MPAPSTDATTDTAEQLIAFPRLFSQQVNRSPDAVAVVHEGREFTYRRLEQMVDSIAGELTASGVAPGDHVGLCAHRSAEAIAAMIGIMKAGAAFVPLDPEFPVDRLRFMIDDAEMRSIVAHPECRSLLLDSGVEDAGEVQWIELDRRILDSQRLGFVGPEVGSDAMAYLMYTSGSTGNPKGVQIDHAALATYCFADIDVYHVVPEDRTLQFSTLNFDIAIEEIFPPLLVGSSVFVRPRQRSSEANELSSLIRQGEVTAVHIATAYWHEWVDLMVASGSRVPESVRLMVVTGEKVSVEHYKRWLTLCDSPVRWCNAYGPTEATVSSTVFVPQAGEPLTANMPIGKPLKRYDAYILNESLQRVADDETGVLYLGGPALARGYLNRPELTHEVFQTVSIDGQDRRLYKTGDLARWLPGGDIDFGGRIDHQIKLGSYRIEPGEIEAVIDQHPDLLESLVSYDSVAGKKYLVAYCATGDRGRVIGAIDVVNFLRDRLPPYMVPARFVFVEKFPKTTNGKIDRRALPPADQGVVARAVESAPPRNALERKLAEIWEDVLNVQGVSVHDDFFLLGGSSLLVTRVVAELAREFDVELPVRDFFANPTIATATRHLARCLGIPIDSAISDQDAAIHQSVLPQVTAGFLGQDDHGLFGVHYRPPVSSPDSRRHAVLLCHSYGHEYTRAYRNLQQLAVSLARDGFDVFRFDYTGTGNSGGSTTDATVARMVTDTEQASEHIRRCTSVDRFSVVGIRLGAVVLANAELGPVEHRILWDPVDSGQQFLADAGRFHNYAMTSRTRFNRRRRSSITQVFGHAFSEAQLSDFAAARLEGLEESLLPSVWTVLSHQTPVPDFLRRRIPSAERIIRTADAIHWDRREFTESAFASPETFTAIGDILTGVRA